jgi:hypothetical protein
VPYSSVSSAVVDSLQAMVPAFIFFFSGTVVKGSRLASLLTGATVV